MTTLTNFSPHATRSIEIAFNQVLTSTSPQELTIRMKALDAALQELDKDMGLRQSTSERTCRDNEHLRRYQGAVQLNQEKVSRN